MTWSVVGAEVQILVAKKTSPTRLTLTRVPGTACTMYTTWISLTLSTSRTLPPVLASEKQKRLLNFCQMEFRRTMGGSWFSDFFPILAGLNPVIRDLKCFVFYSRCTGLYWSIDPLQSQLPLPKGP